MKVYLINLERDVHRRVAMMQMLGGLGIAPVVIPAIDGKTIDPCAAPLLHDEGRAGRFLKRPLFASELGCSLSHLLAYEQIAADEDPAAVVMEDDIVIDESFLEVLAALSRTMIAADILLLGHHPPHSLTALTRTSLWGRQQVDARRFLGFPVEPAFGAYCYVITRRAASKILDLNRPVWAPADHFTAGCDGSIRNVALVPPVARVNLAIASNIQPDRLNVAPPAHGSTLRNLLKSIWPLRRARQMWVSAQRECLRFCRSFMIGPRPPAMAPMSIPRMPRT